MSVADLHSTFAVGFESAYTNMIDALFKYGYTTCPRGQETKELISFMFGFEDSRQRLIYNPERNVNIAFMLAECLWIATGHGDVEMISYYNSKIAAFSDDGVSFHGAYGPRLRCLNERGVLSDQFKLVIDKLREDPDSRQAVCNIFYAGRDYKKTKDVPCTLTFQFFIRERGGTKRLNMIANMRSSDVMLGLSTDVFNFTTIQELIASELDIEPGDYYHVEGSLHMYKRDFEWAERILKNRGRLVKEILVMPPMPPNSLTAIAQVDVLEQKIRKGLIQPSEFLTVPEYWQKWLYVFACYKALKENNVLIADSYVEKIGDHPFAIFLQRSIDRKKEKLIAAASDNKAD